jgi:hypothetical protein
MAGLENWATGHRGLRALAVAIPAALKNGATSVVKPAVSVF